MRGEQVMYTCDMEAAGPFRIKIDSFEGSKQDLTLGFSAEHADMLLANLFIEAQLMEGDVPIGLPSRTLYASYGGDAAAGANHRVHTSQCRWTDLLTFSHVRYWHLARNAEIHLTLRALCAPRKMVTLGHCSFSLFSKKGRLKSGRKKVVMEMYSKPSEQDVDDLTDSQPKADTPATTSPANADDANTAGDGVKGKKKKGTVSAVGVARMDKLEKVMQRYDSNAMSRSPWLDVLTFRRIDQLNQAMGSGSRRPVMMVEMERWDRCVMYGVKSYSIVPPAATWCVADAELCCDSPVKILKTSACY